MCKLPAPEKQDPPLLDLFWTWLQSCLLVPCTLDFSCISAKSYWRQCFYAEGLAFPTPNSKVPSVIPLVSFLRFLKVCSPTTWSKGGRNLIKCSFLGHARDPSIQSWGLRWKGEWAAFPQRPTEMQGPPEGFCPPTLPLS